MARSISCFQNLYKSTVALFQRMQWVSINLYCPIGALPGKRQYKGKFMNAENFKGSDHEYKSFFKGVLCLFTCLFDDVVLSFLLSIAKLPLCCCFLPSVPAFRL